MLQELTPPERAVLRPLFEAMPYMRTVTDAVLNHSFGLACADDRSDPRVGWLKLDFSFLAGDPTLPAAQDFLKLAGNDVVAAAEWRGLIEATWGSGFRTHRRVSFTAAHFDRVRLDHMVRTVPAGYRVERVGHDLVGEFDKLGTCLVGNFSSFDDYIARGVGFAALDTAGRIVSGASSFCVAGGDLEVEIQTIAPERRRGLATATAARLILHCLEHGLTPHWDAHNAPSAALAHKLGFGGAVEYDAYIRHHG